MYMFYNVHRVSLVWTAFLGNSFSDRRDYLYCIQTFDQETHEFITRTVELWNR